MKHGERDLSHDADFLGCSFLLMGLKNAPGVRMASRSWKELKDMAECTLGVLDAVWLSRPSSAAASTQPVLSEVNCECRSSCSGRLGMV